MFVPTGELCMKATARDSARRDTGEGLEESFEDCVEEILERILSDWLKRHTDVTDGVRDLLLQQNRLLEELIGNVGTMSAKSRALPSECVEQQPACDEWGLELVLRKAGSDELLTPSNTSYSAIAKLPMLEEAVILDSHGIRCMPSLDTPDEHCSQTSQCEVSGNSAGRVSIKSQASSRVSTSGVRASRMSINSTHVNKSVDALVKVMQERRISSRIMQRQSLHYRVLNFLPEMAYRCDDNAGYMRTYLQSFVQTKKFDLFCGGVILLHTALVGWETDYILRYSNDASVKDVQNVCHVIQRILNWWYILELMCRVFADGPRFWCGAHCRWNILDMILVSVSVCETLISRNSYFARVRVLTRIARVLRLVRALRHFVKLKKMIIGLFVSMSTLFWALFLLASLMYFFSLWFIEQVAHYLKNGDVTEIEKGEFRLDELYGSLGQTFFTLFMCITGGVDWGDVVRPLYKIDSTLPVIFCAFISFVVFGLFNIMTSVFVECAMETTNLERDLIIQESRSKKEVYTEHVRSIFNSIDTDNSGTISFLEIYDFLSNQETELYDYFEALELDAQNVYMLFRMMDDDSSGIIDLDEFCDGFLRLKGEARSYDVHCILHELKKMHRKLQYHNDFADKKLKRILECSQESLARQREIIEVVTNGFQRCSLGFKQLNHKMGLLVQSNAKLADTEKQDCRRGLRAPPPSIKLAE